MPEKISNAELLERITALFRDNGFDGTSLAMVSAATGLQKSSLYHRFPSGKSEMAEAVLAEAGQHIASYVLEPLQGTGAPRRRVRAAAERIAEFYGGGRRSCLLETLSVSRDTPGPLQAALRDALDLWIGAFAAVAREAGATPTAARRRAEHAMIALEGALVVSRVSGDPDHFGLALDALPGTLCG